ncbi:WD repeat-containing protein 5 [Drosophila grimshawi]|uniref:GH22022 n=1 Tax=Drosophila grimshawi TaxID=7222 RepID=B4J9I9_DROGR|nr:WD repeat-containing protein 5 [Drosophila grimshawi]EDW02496.1 GH22022 [Drosophila grimshawi]
MSTTDKANKSELGTAEPAELAAGASNLAEHLFKKPLPRMEFNKKNKVGFTSPGYELKYKLEGHVSHVTAIRFCPNGDWLTSTSDDRSLKMWSIETGQLFQTLDTGHKLGVNDVTWSPDSKFMASCSDDKTIKLWHPHNGHCFRTLVGHTDNVFACSIHPSSSLIASTSFDCTVQLWDVRNGRSLKVVPAHKDPITSVDFNLNGNLFVTGSYDGLVRIWSTISGNVQQTLIDEDNSPVGSVKFAPNGRYILAAHLNSRIKLWNFQKPKCVRIYEGHINVRYCITAQFSVTAGMWIVSGSEDNCLHIWSLQSKELVQKLPAHSQQIVCIDCHPTLSLIATGSMQHSENLRVWQSSELVIE